MSADLQVRLLAAWREILDDIRSPPATSEEIAALERDLGPIPDDFRWFLANMGGGVIGSEWIDDASKRDRSWGGSKRGEFRRVRSRVMPPLPLELSVA